MGLWIDQEKAVIVTMQNGNKKAREISSNTEKYNRFSSRKYSKTSSVLNKSTKEDLRGQQVGDHLDLFYDEVISIIRSAESIWIFGPGEAKVELENRLRIAELGARVVGIEPEVIMTTSQIISKVNLLFGKKH